jgi:cytochrome c oxidase assembly protein subunit 15
MRPYAKLAWSVLGWNLLVIAWGAFVRVTGSGAGCGSHWPLCNGEVVPRAPRLETVIEFSHRATSGLALLLVVALVVGAHRGFPGGHPVRKAAWASLGIMIVEALLGAGLVIFGWVVNDASFSRAIVMGLHLVNTFLLLGALTLTAEWATRQGGLSFQVSGLVAAGLWAAFAAMCVAGVTGAVAALGDTLFPATPYAQGLALGAGVPEEVRALLRLRIAHPITAVLAAAAALVAARLSYGARPDGRVRRAVTGVAVLVAVQLLAGVVNVWLMAPVWMQLLHLLLADGLWISLVLLAAAALAPGEVRAEKAPDAGLRPLPQNG